MGYVKKKVILLPMKGKGIIYDSAQELAEVAGVRASSIRGAIYSGGKTKVNGEWHFVDYAIDDGDLAESSQ